MAVIADFKSTTLITFPRQNVVRGSTVYTNGLKSFTGLPEAGFRHVARSQPRQSSYGKARSPRCLWWNRAIGNLRQWLIETYYGVSRNRLQVYSYFATIGAGNTTPRSRPCSASRPDPDPGPNEWIRGAEDLARRLQDADHNLSWSAETIGKAPALYFLRAVIGCTRSPS